MLVWEIFSGTNIEWDEDLLACQDSHVYQSYAWGESQRASGWTPLRLAGRSADGATLAMAQILMKSCLGGINIGWSPGGPTLRFPQARSEEISEIIRSLCAKLQEMDGSTCVRFDNHLLSNHSLSFAFSRVLRRPLAGLNSPYSLHFDLRQSMDVLEKGMTSDVRRNIKKASAHNIQWKAGNNEVLMRDLLRLYDEMLVIKRTDSFGDRHKKIPGICSALGKDVLIFNGYLEGEAVSSCLVLLFGKNAMFRERATGVKGREMGVSHALIFNLIEYLKNNGIEHLDLGGLGPHDPALRGVNSFKMGFGGEVVEYLGEWEWSNASWLSRAVSLAVWIKNR